MGTVEFANCKNPYGCKMPVKVRSVSTGMRIVSLHPSDNVQSLSNQPMTVSLVSRRPQIRDRSGRIPLVIDRRVRQLIEERSVDWRRAMEEFRDGMVIIVYHNIRGLS